MPINQNKDWSNFC